MYMSMISIWHRTAAAIPWNSGIWKKYISMKEEGSPHTVGREDTFWRYEQLKKKLGFISLGCSKNLVDTEMMVGIMEKAGYELTEDLSEAQVIIINTCTFIDLPKKNRWRLF